jgi:hypothetical protein
MRWDYFGSSHGKGKALTLFGCDYILCSNFIIGIMSISGISPLMKFISFFVQKLPLMDCFCVVPGEWDKASVVVKIALRNEQQLNPNRELQESLQCVQFLTEKLSTCVSNMYSKKKPLISRKFWHIDESAVVRSNLLHVQPSLAPGVYTRSFHSLLPIQQN